jgi:head-tail adaptor
MLTTRELAQMRADVERATLPDICVLQSMTSIPDNEGGMTETWAASGTVMCRLDNLSGSRRPIGQAIQPFNSWTLTVPQSTEIDTLNRVVVNGFTFSVIAVSDVGSWLTCRRAALEWIE